MKCILQLHVTWGPSLCSACTHNLHEIFCEVTTTSKMDKSPTLTPIFSLFDMTISHVKLPDLYLHLLFGLFRKGIMSSLPPTTLPNPPTPIARPAGRAGRSTPRRSSSRSIKRKKFDDELVESSLKKASKQRGDVTGLEKEIKRTLVSC